MRACWSIGAGSSQLGPLTFRSADLFARKNNRSLRETIQHPKYVQLAGQVLASYPGVLEQRLGDFLLGLKNASDPFYRNFLNRHGDLVYCEFCLPDRSLQQAKDSRARRNSEKLLSSMR
jgi:hypothetical protein